MDEETNSQGNLLRTWNGSTWDTSPWNWNVSYTYESDTWYYAEIERSGGYLTLKFYDINELLIMALGLKLNVLKDIKPEVA